MKLEAGVQVIGWDYNRYSGAPLYYVKLDLHKMFVEIYDGKKQRFF